MMMRFCSVGFKSPSKHSYPTTLSFHTKQIKYTFCTSLQASPNVHRETTIPGKNYSFLVDADLKKVKQNIISLLSTDHPLLKTMARYYFDLEGKQFRPMVLLLLSRAIECHKTFPLEDGNILPKQLQLAEIVEMIHTASIIHDDVIDKATLRRSVSSINQKFGNKLSVLSGDYLLARASVSLAQLESFEVTKLISTVISDLVEGEFMQLNPTPDSSPFDYYIKKTYLKTASLIANSCTGLAVLSGVPSHITDIATNYGKNLGIAFQIIDDILDFSGASSEMGKEAGVDMNLGLATAPVLYANQQFPQLTQLIQRKFSEPGDVDLAHNLVLKSDGLKRSRELAKQFGMKATESLHDLNPSQAKDGLIQLVDTVLNRHK